MAKKKDAFGIDIKQWCRDHEAAVAAVLGTGGSAGPAGRTGSAVQASQATPADSTAQVAEATQATPVEAAALLQIHREKLVWLQHERLVHLIVTVMTVIVELFVVALVVLHPELGVLPAVIMLVLAVLLGCYFWHYFFLENTVQHWYRLAGELAKLAGTSGRPGK